LPVALLHLEKAICKKAAWIDDPKLCRVNHLSITNYLLLGGSIERVGMNRIRQLRNKILNETPSAESHVAALEQQEQSMCKSLTGYFW